MFGFPSSDPAQLGSASPGFASSSSFGVSPLSESPASFSLSSLGSTSSYSFATNTSPLFGSPASSSSQFWATLPASSRPSPFEATATIHSNLFGSTSSASARSFSFGVPSSRAPANSSSFGSGSTFVSVSFKSSSSAPNAYATTGLFSGSVCRTSSSGATTTTSTISSLSPSIKILNPATSSVSETQSTAARPSIGDDEIGSEAEQVSESVEKVPIDQMAKIGQNQDEKQGTMVGEQDCATSSMDPTASIIEVTAIPAKVHVATAEQIAAEANKLSAKEVDDEPPESSSTESEVFDGDKIGHPASESPASIESSPFADFEDLALALQNSSLSQYATIFNQIFGRYGDISNESKLKSVEAKAAFFQLLAKVVEWLSNHTLESLDSGELQRMQEWIDDAEAVGFKVKWLQQRFKTIVTNSRYQECQMQLNEIGEQISATKIALTEMEIRQITLKQEVDSMKVELDGDNLDESNLCEGLF